MKKFLFLAAFFSLSSAPLRAEMAEAKLASTSTSTYVAGLVKFEDTSFGLKVTAVIDKAPVGAHGFHIHEYGDCGDFGNKSGTHYNPAGHQHGNATKSGGQAHPGDMGNIEIGADGRGKLDAVLPGVTLTSGKMPVAGRAVIFHAKADDFSQPLGNAGGRIGCGPIVLTGK